MLLNVPAGRYATTNVRAPSAAVVAVAFAWLKRNPACPLCGDNPTVTELIDYEIFCGVAAPEGAAVGSD